MENIVQDVRLLLEEDKLNEIMQLIEQYKDNLTESDYKKIIGLSADLGDKIIIQYGQHLSGKTIASSFDFINATDKEIQSLLERFLEKFDSADIGKFIENIKSQKIKKQLVSKYSNMITEEYLIEIIDLIKDDNIKFELLENNNVSEEGYLKIIKYMNNDKMKLKLIDKNKDKMSEEFLSEVIQSIDKDTIKLELIEEYKDKISKDNLLKIIISVHNIKDKIGLVKEVSEQVSAQVLLQAIEELDGEERIKIYREIKEKVNTYAKEKLPEDRSIVDSFEELYMSFGKCVFDSPNLITKECEQILGKENCHDLIKYFGYVGEKVDVEEIMKKPELFKKYEEFRKNLYEEKQMKVMNLKDSIDEFGDNTSLIEDVMEKGVSEEEKKILRVALKEKNVEIENKDELAQFSQKRKEKIEEMINKNSKEAIIYLLTGMSEEAYNKKCVMYLNEKQVDGVIKDFDDLDVEMEIIKATNKFIDMIGGMEEQDRKRIAQLYNADLANEFSDKGSIVAKARSAFEDIEIKMRKIYGNELSKSLMEHELPEGKITKGVEIIELKGQDFKLLIHGIDAYGAGTGRFDKRDVGQAYICTSLISEKKMARAEAKRYYGFRNIGRESLIQSGKVDIYSDSTHENSLEVFASSDMELAKADKLLEGKEYNEIDLWREYLDDDGKKKDVWPEYVVCFNRISKADREEAKRLNIPIVLIDERAYKKMQKKEDEIDLDDLEEEQVEENIVEQKPEKVEEQVEYKNTIRRFIDIFRGANDKCSAHDEQSAMGKFVAEMQKQLTLEKEGHEVTH